MNRRLLTLSFLSAIIVASAPLTQAQEVKIGLVDFARIQKSFHRTYSEREDFESMRKSEQEKVDERRSKIKELLGLQQEADKKYKDPTLSTDAKKKILDEAKERQGQITSAQREVIEMEGRIQKELADKANQIQRSLTKEIYDVIGQVSESKSLDVVFNRTFGINGVPTVAYSSTKVLEDFTDEVVAAVNKNAPEGWEPPEAAEAKPE